MRRKSGAVLCTSCRQLIGVSEKRCPHCGALAPGLFGFGPELQRVFRDVFEPVQLVVGVCVALYVLAVALDPSAALGGGGLFSLGSPSSRSLYLLGMTGGAAAQAGLWWTPLTSIYLHGGLLHIIFNLMWVRQHGPLSVEAFGRARFFVIYNVAGIAGMVLSNAVSGAPTIGASGAVFGLLGAMWAWGRRRGGTVGAGVSRQMFAWAVPLFLIGLVFPGVNNTAHLGGFVAGYALARLLPYAERRREARGSQLAALFFAVATPVALVATVLRMRALLG